VNSMTFKTKPLISLKSIKLVSKVVSKLVIRINLNLSALINFRPALLN